MLQRLVALACALAAAGGAGDRPGSGLLSFGPRGVAAGCGRGVSGKRADSFRSMTQARCAVAFGTHVAEHGLQEVRLVVLLPLARRLALGSPTA